jgi:four helix bundle protein
VCTKKILEYMQNFRKLKVYIVAKELVKQVYHLVQRFPSEERYGLADQLRRSVISVPSNVAEGLGRATDKDKGHFMQIAYGSLMETYSQLQVAVDLGYISEDSVARIAPFVVELRNKLSALRRSYNEK